MKNKYGPILKPFTVYRPEYFDGLAKEAVPDHIQLEANLEWLANQKQAKEVKCIGD